MFQVKKQGIDKEERSRSLDNNVYICKGEGGEAATKRH